MKTIPLTHVRVVKRATEIEPAPASAPEELEAMIVEATTDVLELVQTITFASEVIAGAFLGSKRVRPRRVRR